MAICVFLVAALLISVASAEDQSPLQDFCVAQSGGVGVNGLPCKDAKMVQASDFSLSGFHLVGDTNNALGSKVTPATVTQLPGLNTLGVSLARIDFSAWGINPPHTHPRASEILVVIEGTLNVGFITSNPDNKLISKTLHQGDVFVFPQGLVHFQQNAGNTNAVAIVGLSSQNPGVITIGNSVFGSNGKISTDILAKAFQTDKNVINKIQAKF